MSCTGQYQGNGIAAFLWTMYISVRINCPARWGAVTETGSSFRVMAERNLLVHNEARMRAKRSTTSSIVGRRAGSSLVISSTSSCMNSKPSYFCNNSVSLVSTVKDRRRTGAYLHETPTNDVSKVIDIGLKRIAARSTPMFGCRRIATSTWFVKDVS